MARDRELYRARGFRVVSLQLPPAHALAAHSDSPRSILVDPSGKLRAIEPSYAELHRHLQDWFGPPYQPSGRLHYVDLSEKANRKLTNVRLLNDDVDNHLGELPRGERTLGGVSFRICDQMLQILGVSVRPDDPKQVAGIAVQCKVATLYVLHGTEFDGGKAPIADGTVIAWYVLRYEDGMAEKLPVVYGEDVRDWRDGDGSLPVSRGVLAWSGSNPASRRSGLRLRLDLSALQNPHPDKLVRTVDYVARPLSPALPFCVAMTVEEPSGCDADPGPPSSTKPPAKGARPEVPPHTVR